MPKYRIKSDILGVDFGIRTDEKLTERDYFDILKTKVQPQDLLHAYKSAPYDEKRQNLAIKALDNGFFEQDVGFTESMAEVGGMVAQGIGNLLTTNIYATSRLQGARMKYGDADTEQVYQPQIEEGIKKAGQQLKGLAYAAKRTDRSIEDDLSQAMQFAGIPRDDENLKKRVIAEAQRQDDSQVAATQAQTAVEAAGMMAMLGGKGNEAIERIKADSPKESKLAQVEYLAEKFNIAEKIEKGAELGLAEGGLLSSLSRVYLDKNLSPFDVNQEALEDVRSGLVEPDREVALVGSVVADPSFVLTFGAAGGVNAMRNVLARGMVIRTGEKAAQESALRSTLVQLRTITNPNNVQKNLIKSAEQKLAKVAGSTQRLDKLVAKSQGVAQAQASKLIQAGQANSQQSAMLMKALENAPAPKAPIFNRMTGKILERAGMTTETLGRTIEFIQRLPEETLTTLFMKTGGMSQEAALTAARGTARTLQAGAAAGVVTGGFNEFSPELENLALALLLAPGGSSLITRFGHDAAILGKQLQFAQASSPLFQRIAQLDPADASLTSVIVDRSSALTIPQTISGLAEGVFSKSRQFGPSPALKVPSTALARTGLGNTLTGAVNTAKTVVGASTIPGAIGYAIDGEAGAGGAIGASWPFLAAGLTMGTLVKVGSKADLYMKMAGDEAYFKDTYLDSTDRAIYESQPRIVRQSIATSNIQYPDVIYKFKEGKPPPGEGSNFSIENGESVITIYGKSHPQEILSAVFGHEIAHHIDAFGFMPQIIEQLVGSVEKGKPGIFTKFSGGQPVIKTVNGRDVYATNLEFSATHADVRAGNASKIGYRQQYLDKLEASGVDKNSKIYKQYADNDAQIAREIFAAHGADWYFGGEFVKKNWQGAGSKMMGAILDPLFGSTGLRKFFHRIGLATSEQSGLVADPTGLFPGLKKIPSLTRMIEKYNSDVRGYGPQARREGRGRGNLVDPEFGDEIATVRLTASDLADPAIVNRLKAGGVVRIKDDGTIETDVQGRPVFLPPREVNKNNKKLSNDILEIIQKKENAGETFGEGHVSLKKTADGKERATGIFLDPSIIDQLQGKYNPHQLAALKQINQTLRDGTGEVWNLFYYSALKYNKAGRKVYGQIKGGDRSSLPFGIEITKDGNINIRTISMDAFIKNLEWFAKSKGYSQKMAQAFGGMNQFQIVQNALSIFPKYLQNHLNNIENGTKNPASGITDGQRDLLNGAIGRINADQVKANPVLEGLGDRRSQRQQSYRSRRLDRIGNAIKGEPGYPAVISAIEKNKLPMRIPAYHGTPHTLAPEAGAPLGRFRTSKIGTGEGAQAYGHGLYFAGRKEVAEHYRKMVGINEDTGAKIKVDGQEMPTKFAELSKVIKDPIKRDAIRALQKHNGDFDSALDFTMLNKTEEQIGKKAINDLRGRVELIENRGSLYKVELAPKENEYLLYDKTLGEQPKSVQDKLKKFLREQEGEDTWQYRQEQDYRDITNNVLDDMPEPEISRRLKEAGIPGIKYLDGASRSKGEGDYNYVIFDEADVTVTDKLFMPSDSAYLTEVKKGNTSKVVDLINQEAKKAGYIKVLRVVPKGVDLKKAKPINHADWVVPDNEVGHAYLNAYDGSDWKARAQYAYVKENYLVDQQTGFEKKQTYTIGDTRLNESTNKLFLDKKDIDPNGIKSADPVIYDASGDIIPLSKRFNQSPDKLFMPASEAGAGKGKQAEAAKLWKEKGIDSPYFKKWFGKSKVVDENGEPLVVYHGTPGGEFNVFDYDRIGNLGRMEGQGFYFATDKGMAQSYMGKDGRLMEVYLDIEKPMSVEQKGFDADTLETLLMEIAEEQHRYDPEVPIDEGFLADYGGLYNAVDLISKNETALDQLGDLMGAGVNAEFINTALKKVTGFDGVKAKITDKANDFTSDIYVAFSPEQIKSATGNRGTFDAGERNINYMPSDPKAPKAQPANRIQQQAPAMPGNRFMAPAASAGAKLSERFGK